MADLISEIVGNRLMKIKQSQATPDTFLNQFDPRAEVSPSGRYTASNYVGTLNQGLGNILGSVAAPEQRKEAARQEQIAAEQELYKRSQDAANLALQERGENRADTRLAFDQAAEARKVKLQGEADTLKATQAALTADAYQKGKELNTLKVGQRDNVAAGIKQGWLTADDKGEYSYTGNSPKQKAAYDNLIDTEKKQRELIGALQDRAAATLTDNIKGNEILDTSGLEGMVTSIGNRNLTPTQLQNEQFAAANAALDKGEVEALRQTTGIISGNPALQQIQSDLSYVNNDFEKLDTDVIGEAVKANIGIEDKAEAKREINSWISKAKAGDFDESSGSKISELAKGNGKEFQYYVSKAIQNAGGSEFFSTKWGDFENTELVKQVLSAQHAVDQVRNVNAKQEAIKAKFGAERIKAKSLFTGQTTGKVLTK